MTVWALFEKGTEYFEPSRTPFMLNYRVDDLDALFDTLRAKTSPSIPSARRKPPKG
jgi:hypothetical protein